MTRGDEQRLKFIMQDLESYFKVEKNRYEYAMDIAEEHGRTTPTKEDELEGFRRLIDEAIIVHKFIG